MGEFKSCCLMYTGMLPESLLWAYIVQLSSVIRTIHTAGLAVRSLDPTKILVTSRTRPSIRLNCCGIYDIVSFDPNASPAQLTPFYQVTILWTFYSYGTGKLLRRSVSINFVFMCMHCLARGFSCPWEIDLGTCLQFPTGGPARKFIYIIGTDL